MNAKQAQKLVQQHRGSIFEGRVKQALEEIYRGICDSASRGDQSARFKIRSPDLVKSLLNALETEEYYVRVVSTDNIIFVSWEAKV